MPDPTPAPAMTDRRELREVAYATSNLLADRAALYAARIPPLQLSQWVADQLPPRLPGPIVDVGCGPGWYLLTTGPTAGRPALGLDLSLGMAREAQAAAVHSSVDGGAGVADAQALPLRTGSAGAVLLLHMLYHVPDPELALREAKRVVHAAGVVAVLTNKAGHLKTMRDLLAAELEARGIAPITNAEQHFDDTTGRAILERVFGRVDEHALDATIELDRAAPALAHLATGRHLYPELDGGWHDVLVNVGRQIEQVIEREGRWRTPVSSVFYTCHG